MTGSPTPFVGQLGREDAEALLKRARRRTIARSEPILHQSSAGDEVAIVISGRVKLVAAGAEGREVVLAIRGAGEMIGEMAALGAIRRTATAIAIDDAEVGFLAAQELREFLAEHPAASLALMRTLIRRFADADRDRIALATQDSVGRLAKRLLELSGEHGVQTLHGVRIELSLSQDELASWTGATRETVSRALRLMRTLGWVATDHGAITILNPTALRQRAGG